MTSGASVAPVPLPNAVGGPELPAQFFRHQAGRLVAHLSSRFGARHLHSVEDAVQTALMQAVSVWVRDGLPAEPAAWLTRVATNRLIDELRRERRAPLDEGVAAAQRAEAVPAPSAPPDERASGPIDDELRLLFACAHESVVERSRLVLCLKLVCGLSTGEVARQLFTSDANVQKQLERGRAALAATFHATGADGLADLSKLDLRRRLPVVEQVIYLLFDAGYSSERPDAPLRPDLCDDALRLGRQLMEVPEVPRPSTAALMAVMHLQRARLEARVGATGELLLLSEQDRTRWDRAHLAAGAAWLGQAGAAPSSEFSRYHGEALILAEHCFAPTFEQTRWGEIVEVYELLERAYPNPLYVLNRAVALAEWRGPRAGLALLSEQAPARWLAGYYLFEGAIGELERRAGDFDRAVRHLSHAAATAPTRAERACFERRLTRARSGDARR